LREDKYHKKKITPNLPQPYLKDKNCFNKLMTPLSSKSGVFYLSLYLYIMKKITRLTESDVNRIVKKVIKEEDIDIKRWFIRRSDEFLSTLEQLIREEEPCSFGDEFEYAENIINWTMEASFDYDEYENFEDELTNFLNKEFGERLFDVYNDAEC
jgi:hypothetical protein